MTYLLCSSISLFMLWVNGKLFNLPYIIWRAYEYLNTHYGLYNDMEQYDSIPIVRDFLIIWMLFFPTIMTAAIFVFKKKHRDK